MKMTSTITTVLAIMMVSMNAYGITSKEWVDAHNKYRHRHVDTPNVVWDSALAMEAQACVNMEPGTRPNGNHCSSSGENVVIGSVSTADMAVGLWYDEIEKYDYSNPGFDTSTGHFTQVVWKESKRIGCAASTYGAVCRYDPVGNIISQGDWFFKNVKPLKTMGGNILWYHNWGFIGAWYMNGTNYDSWSWIGYGYVDPSWQVGGAADFDNNGSTDILWRNYNTGENLVWHMAGNQVKSTSYLDKLSDNNWKIMGTGDFNDDGQTDILWRHATRYYTQIWLMDGVNRIGQTYLPRSTNPDWNIVGTGDINGDYTTDILWRNTSSGANAVWYLKNGNYFLMDYIESAHTDWEVGATGDLNKDRRTDILWRNKKTGANAVWYGKDTWSPNSGHYFSATAWLPPLSDLNFRMAGTGIFK